MKLRALLMLTLLGCLAVCGAEIRIGIIGCDTSHVGKFTEIINDPKAQGHIPGGKVVAAYKGGSADIPSSMRHIEGYSKEIRTKYGVKIYDTIEDLCKNVDAVLLESVDGRAHLEQVKPVLKARKPVYVDKPMGGSLSDVVEIFRLAKEAKVPLFSSSSLRFGADTQAVRNGSIGKVSYAETYGPCTPEPHHPELYWYGIHGIESLFTVMGTGCESVQWQRTPEGKIEVIGTWSGGRKGIFRENKDFHGLAKGEKGEAPVGGHKEGYVPLVQAIIKFFQTGISPVPPEETIEIFAFMDAAEESKKKDGAAVKLVIASPAQPAKIDGNR